MTICEVCGAPASSSIVHASCIELTELRWRAQVGIADSDDRRKLDALERDLHRVRVRWVAGL